MDLVGIRDHALFWFPVEVGVGVELAAVPIAITATLGGPREVKETVLTAVGSMPPVDAVVIQRSLLPTHSAVPSSSNLQSEISCSLGAPLSTKSPSK
jgi:hypothetical protein